MREAISNNKLKTFLEILGSKYQKKDKLILLGGCALNLLGSNRPTLDVDYVGDDINIRPFDKFIEEIAHTLNLDIEAVPIDKFLPINENDLADCLFFGKFGEIDVFILNPYIIAFSKVERGFDTDIEDVLFLIENNYIDLEVMKIRINSILLQSKEYDIDHNSVQNHWKDVLRQAGHQ